MNDDYAQLIAERKFLEERLASLPATSRITRISTESRLKSINEQICLAELSLRLYNSDQDSRNMVVELSMSELEMIHLALYISNERLEGDDSTTLAALMDKIDALIDIMLPR